MATERTTLTEERRATARAVADALAFGSPALTDFVEERMDAGDPIIAVEYETPAREVREILHHYYTLGQIHTVILMRKGDELESMLSSYDGIDRPVQVRGSEIHDDSPIGMVFEALEMSVRAQRAIPAHMRRSVGVREYAMSMA